MNRDQVIHFCENIPHAEATFPFDEHTLVLELLNDERLYLFFFLLNTSFSIFLQSNFLFLNTKLYLINLPSLK